MSSLTAIYFNLTQKLIVPNGEGHIEKNIIASLQKQLQEYSYILSDEAVNAISKLNHEQLNHIYQELLHIIKRSIGSHVTFTPMYPNFPMDVMNKDDAELYFNAIIHYYTLQLPDSVFLKPREELTHNKKQLRLIYLGSETHLKEVLQQLLNAKVAYSSYHKENLGFLITYYANSILNYLPDQIKNKENLGFIIAELLKNPNYYEIMGWIKAQFKNATDVLRLAVALSNGDISLAKSTKFINFSRPKRVFLLELLNDLPNLAEDMWRWKGRWLRLGERLHPGEYTKRFPHAAAAFDSIRNQKILPRFNRAIEMAFVQKDFPTIIRLLETRGGEFIRRLDHLLRVFPEQSTLIFTSAQKIISGVATAVLLQVKTHLETRNQLTSRIFFPKSEVAKLYLIPADLSPISEIIIKDFVELIENTLIQRFKLLPSLGKYYLDPELKHFLVPFSQRSASNALQTYPRGSQLYWQPSPILRFFLWWKNGIERTDIDLSVALFGENYHYINTIAYYNLKDNGCGIYHSGDIVDAPNGAAEFIDIDIQQCIKNNVRYLIMAISNYTEQPFCDLPECFAGWMERDNINTGEIFESSTVKQKVDITSDSTFCLPAIFDLIENKIIWTDIALINDIDFDRYTNPNLKKNNVHYRLHGVELMLKAFNEMQKTNLYELFRLHGLARGEAVAEKQLADTIFSVEYGITPCHIEKIVAEFMG